MVGTERVLAVLAEDPEWLVDMWNTQLDLDIALYDMVWAAGYRFDSIMWWDDMGFKLKQFFSRKTYQRLLKPVHARAVAWAHAKGIKAHMHTCGDIRPFIPDLVEIGVDILNPIEVKAGMDPLALKRDYGDKLVLHGGLNAALFWHPDQLYAQMEEFIPKLKERGGYICSSDHSVPDSVSLQEFGRFVEKAKSLISY
jgi:uroporphyrinogen decarboxylase